MLLKWTRPGNYANSWWDAVHDPIKKLNRCTIVIFSNGDRYKR
jgi:hypothetical protein